MRYLLIATTSQHKYKEIIEKLDNIYFHTVCLNQVVLANSFSVKESGKSFIENAEMKARAYGTITTLLTLAEDSGLMVDILDGQPGIYSHRYAVGSDEIRYQKLLDELKNVEMNKRTAKYISAFAIFDPKTDKMKTCQALCKGVITKYPLGSEGFGFDPIFFLPQLSKTMAELTLREKNTISHRGKALRKVKKILVEEFSTNSSSNSLTKENKKPPPM